MNELKDMVFYNLDVLFRQIDDTYIYIYVCHKIEIEI